MSDAKGAEAELADLRRRLAAAEERLAEVQAKLARAAERERQLDAVLAHAPVVVFAVDKNGVFSLSEGRGLSSAGLRPGQVVGTAALPAYGAVEFTDPTGERSDGADVLARVLAGRPYTGLSRLGESVYENHIIPVRDERGAVEGAIGIATDVTERHQAQAEQRKLEEKLRQTQKMEAIGRLAGGVAHDFNNLLTAIMGGIQFAVDGLPEGDPLRVELRDSLDAATRAASLTRQLLAFSRKQPLEARLVDLNAVVRDLGSMLRRLVGEAVALEVELCPAPLWVRVDPGQIEQVIVNLVINARDAMGGSGRLRIAVGRASLEAKDVRGHPGASLGPHAVLAVSDEGVGMDTAVLERLFEPFFTTKEVGHGTGLGLSTVHGVVQQSGGHVVVESAPGSGSTFRVFLPEQEAPAQGAAAASASPPQASLPAGNATILVAEDEPAVRAFMSKALARGGYQVLEAEGAAQALALSQAHPTPIDLLVADVVMPGLSGPELAARLRAARPGLRVLFISGYLEERAGGGEAGADVLSKPLSAEVLLARVRAALAPAAG